MARANVARRQGDDFQARLFWLKAASLLDPVSPVIKVSYETGPKSFDDITIEYNPDYAPPDHEGKPIYRRHIQCKWHTIAGVFGYEDLIDPAFINASQFSLLQRARQAQVAHASDGFGCRFELMTNWRLKADDPLMELVRKESDALDLNRLFDGTTTDRSRMGRVRKLWCDHLEVDHNSLRHVARVFAVAEVSESLASLRERLDNKFAAVGMRRVPATESGFFYDDLIVKLLAQGRVEFDRESFRAMCHREGLLQEPVPQSDALTIGVRSFMHPIDNLEDRCERMLNLVPHFDGRYVRNEADWHDRIFPELRGFVVNAARSADHIRLILDAHVSLAVAVGALLNVKSGKRIEIEQRTGGRRFWAMDDGIVEMRWPKFVFDQEFIREDTNDIAVAVGLTHDVSGTVGSFITSRLHQVGRILHCRPEGGPSQGSVRCGRHAWMLAESIAQHVRHLQKEGVATGKVHIFIAGPNGFAFFLGQHHQTYGPAAIYEWDFDGQHGGGYSLALTLGRQ